MSSNPEQPFDAAPSDFLRSLVDAMRRVVEATRDRTLAEMRDAVDAEASQLDAARSAREAALRDRAEAEITGIGSWERAEIERIRAEALRKVQARGGQLDQELAELAASTTAEHAALAARADAYEHEVSTFIQGLEGIDDPAAFAAAARRLPSPRAVKAPPSLAAPRAAIAVVTHTEHVEEPAAAQEPAPEPMPPTPEPVAAATDGAGSGERNGDAAASDAAASDVAAQAAAEVLVEVADEATPIQVRGLSSFGAITSFKQSLERVDGIRSVTLGLGPGGEFVYTATHAPTFDLGGAIRAIEDEGVEIEQDNGTLRVKVGKKAG